MQPLIDFPCPKLYAGVPAIIGNKGVEKIVEIKLDTKEKENFEVSVKAVKDLLKIAIKIDPSLAN